jgi:hypothetical protein
MGPLEETKGWGKEEKNDRVNYIEMHHICVGTRQTNPLKSAQQYGVGGKGEEE